MCDAVGAEPRPPAGRPGLKRSEISRCGDGTRADPGPERVPGLGGYPLGGRVGYPSRRRGAERTIDPEPTRRPRRAPAGRVVGGEVRVTDRSTTIPRWEPKPAPVGGRLLFVWAKKTGQMEPPAVQAGILGRTQETVTVA